MAEEEVVVEGEGVEVEVEVTDVPKEEVASPEGQEARKSKGMSGSEAIKEAIKHVENFGQALSEALQARGNVVMVRVNDEALEHLDMLVEAEITKSRSESAAFLINEGINANESLFVRIRSITEQIADLRDQLRQQIGHAAEEEA